MRCTGETLAYPKHPIKLTPQWSGSLSPVSQWGKHHKNRPLPENLPSGVRRHREKMLMANGCNSMLELVAKYYGTYAE